MDVKLIRCYLFGDLNIILKLAVNHLQQEAVQLENIS